MSMRKLLWAIVPIAVVVAAAGADAKGKPVYRTDVNPIIFVHGGSGSGAQFASQAMRFTANGYDPAYIGVVEYNSAGVNASSSADQAFIFGLIDAPHRGAAGGHRTHPGGLDGALVRHDLEPPVPGRPRPRREGGALREHRRPDGGRPTGRRPDAGALGRRGEPSGAG